VLELVSDLVAARLATVLVANAFDELTSSVFVSLSEFVELLLLALSDASAQFDAEFDAFDTEFVEALDVPNVSEAFFVAAKVVVKPLLDEVFMPAVNEAAPVNEVVLLPAAFVVKSPATAGPLVVGLLAVVPVLPEVLPPLDAVLADDELAVSVAVPCFPEAAKAPVELLLPCEFLVVARLSVVASVAAPVLAEVAVRPELTVDPNVDALVVAEFFDEAAVNVSDLLLLALAFCAADFVSVLLLIVANVFDLSLVYDLLSVVAVFSEVVRLDA
jgi:hypothetical protein